MCDGLVEGGSKSYTKGWIFGSGGETDEGFFSGGFVCQKKKIVDRYVLIMLLFRWGYMKEWGSMNLVNSFLSFLDICWNVELR